MIICHPCFFLILSLDPDSDPLCMLLLIDFLMLRSREYQSLLQLYQDWEVRPSIERQGVPVCLHCGIFQLASINSTFVFCLSGAQKSVPAAQLCILHCTLPLLSQPAVRHGLWRKQQAKTKSWPDAAERSHNVSWRLLNPLSGFFLIHHITVVSSHISSDFCSCKCLLQSWCRFWISALCSQTHQSHHMPSLVQRVKWGNVWSHCVQNGSKFSFIDGMIMLMPFPYFWAQIVPYSLSALINSIHKNICGNVFAARLH